MTIFGSNTEHEVLICDKRCLKMYLLIVNKFHILKFCIIFNPLQVQNLYVRCKLLQKCNGPKTIDLRSTWFWHLYKKCFKNDEYFSNKIRAKSFYFYCSLESFFILKLTKRMNVSWKCFCVFIQELMFLIRKSAKFEEIRNFFERMA